MTTYILTCIPYSRISTLSLWFFCYLHLVQFYRLKILEEHRKNCEQRGNYVEAEIAKNRLEDIKKHEENRKVEVMRARHIAERLGLEEANMLEYNQITRTWDKTMADYEMNAQKLSI